MTRQYTSSQKVSKTIASADKSELSQIDIPSGEVWQIYSIWGQGGSGFFHVEPTTMPAMKSNYVQNVGADEIYVHENDKGWPVNITVAGPSTITCSVTNDAATSIDCNIGIMYSVTFAN